MFSLRQASQTSSLARRALSTNSPLPKAQLRHKTPGDLFTIPATGRQLIVGVPAAFSPGCSNSHIPGYLAKVSDLKQANVEGVYVISVNDVFTMNAWSASFDKSSTNDVLSADGSQEDFIKFLADHDGSWTKEAETGFDASKILGSVRSKRFAAIIDNGKVSKVFIEPDNTGITISSAEKYATPHRVRIISSP